MSEGTDQNFEDRRIPYPGLRAYESEESDLFFGREGCVDEMLLKLSETRFLAVLGTSGSGKSSLVRTGLLDALELGFLAPAGSHWAVADMHPGGRPMRNLARALLAIEGTEDEIELSLMQSFLARGPRSLIQWIDDGNLPDEASLLLLVDQFEELFRYQDYAGREEAEAFVALLLESARAHPRIHVVLTMRSEFLGACALMPGLSEQINAGLYLTRRMNRDECRQAIEGPARVLGFDVEPRLVNHILNDLSTFAPWEIESEDSSLAQLARRADQLPLMQHVLNRLWQKARDGDGDLVLTYDDYLQLGGLGGAIDAHAEELLESLDKAHLDFVGPVFRNLIAGTSVLDAVREPKAFGDLVALVGDRDAVVAIVDTFRARGCNFLRPPDNIVLDDESVIDLGHESLIRQWSSLGEWLVEEARATATWARLTSTQQAYDAGEGDLLSGLDLAIARDWWAQARPSALWARHKGGDYDAVKAFVDLSATREDAAREEAEKEQSRKARSLRRRAFAYLVLAVVSIGAAGYALLARNDALEAQSIALAAEREATTQRDAAEAATARAETALSVAEEAAETFLIDVATRFRRSIGIPPEDVDNILAQGGDFLDRLQGEMGREGDLYRARARLLTEAAAVATSRSEFEEVFSRLSEARNLILSPGRDLANLPAADLSVLIEIGREELYALRSTAQMQEAQTKGEALREIFEKHGDRLEPEQRALSLASVYGSTAVTSAYLDRHEEAEAMARKCIDELDGHGAIDVLRRRAYCASSLVWIARRFGNLTDDVQDEAIEIVEAIPAQDRDAYDWDTWFVMYGNIANDEHSRGNYAEANRVYDNLTEQIERLIAAAPFDENLISRRANILSNQSYVLQDLGRSRLAYDAITASIKDHQRLDPSWRANRRYAEDFRSTLNQAQYLVEQVDDWQREPELLSARLSHYEMEKDVVETMLANGLMESCEGCIHHIDSFVINSMAKLALLDGDFDQFSSLYRVFDQLWVFANETLENSNSDVAKAQARRALYWSASALPQEPELMELIDHVPTRITILKKTIERLEMTLNKFPFAQLIQERSDRAYALLARQYLANGQPVLASEAVKRGVALNHFESLSLLMEWSERGNGPLPRDRKLATQIGERLAAQVWGPRNYTVKVRTTYHQPPREETHRFFIYDRPMGKGSAFDAALREAAELKGHIVSDADVERLRRVEQKAEAAGQTFMQYATGQPKPGETDLTDVSALVAELQRYAAEERQDTAIVSAAQLLWNARKKGEEGVQAADDAVRYLLRHPSNFENIDLFNFARNISLVFMKSEAFDGAIAIYGIMLEQYDKNSAVGLSRLLNERGLLHSYAGQHEAAYSDWLRALAVSPDDPELLNNLGYGWADREEMLPLAVEMLERAVELETAVEGSEKLPFYQDSLGWAYVVSGQIEQGLALLEVAVTTASGSLDEIWFHIGDAHRRLADLNEAETAYRKALTFEPDDNMRRRIETQIELVTNGQ